MKKTKIIVPALGMLLLSTAASVTGTVAWFAMNSSVTATGMQVTAKADGFFLEITGAADSGAYSNTGTSNVNAELYPVSHEAWTAVSQIEDFDIAVADTYDNWYYQYSASTASANYNLTNKAYISAFTNYVAKTSFSVRLNENSGATTVYDLMVSKITIPENKGIYVVVAGADGYEEFSSTISVERSYNANYVLSDTVLKTPVTNVNVYIFFEGSDTNVYSDNIASLTGSVSFELKVFSADNA